MPVRQEQFNELYEQVCAAEDAIRLENPNFVSGFHVISMQAHRVEFTIDRLRSIKANLKEAEQVLLDNIAGLRIANPNQKPRGTNYAKRMLRDKPLWQKVVYAHTLSMDSKAKIDPNLSDSNDFDSDEETELSKALKKMSAKDAKVEFERHDYTLRLKLQGIKKLMNLMNEYIGLLTPRLKKLEYLEGIGRKWTRRVFEDYDIEKLAKAQKEVVDGSDEVKFITAAINLFPEDFTKLCELEDVGRGLKRKVEWVRDIETPETIKKFCTVATRCKRTRRTL